MSNLFSSLATAGQSLDVFQESLNVVQNNITNSSTPGFAKQSLNIVAQPYDVVASGLAGGVASKGLLSARDELAEGQVRRQLNLQGRFDAQTQQTNTLASFFDATGNSGVPAELNQLFQSFSAWSLAPNSTTARQSVLASAGNLSTGIQSLAANLADSRQQNETATRDTVQQINNLAADIQDLNTRLRNHPDPGLDAQQHSDLEQLAQFVDFSSLQQPDGTLTVVLSGGVPLVIGDHQYTLSYGTGVPTGAANPLAPPSSQILDFQGNDITGQITGGKLSGLLDAHNRVLASILGDGQQAGSLNTFAKTLADTVNNILTAGTVSTAQGADRGSALFIYNNGDATQAASSFAVDPNITQSGLAPVDQNGNSNGNALQLASLANSTANGGINGQTFENFFSQFASAVGNENATAAANQQGQRQIVAQTKTLRDQVSGVSLDEQAVLMVQYQKSYQAAARLISVIDSLTEATINLVHS